MTRLSTAMRALVLAQLLGPLALPGPAAALEATELGIRPEAARSTLPVGAARAVGGVLAAGQALALEAGAGRIITLKESAATVFAADPRVAEVRPASSTSLFVFGVAPGRTTIAAMNAAGNPIAQYEVTIRPSSYGPAQASAALRRLMPSRDLRVEARDKGLALYGVVPNAAEADQAMATARGYVPDGQVVENRLTVLGSIQVNLRVRIAEVSRQVTRQLGLDWQALGSIGRFAIAAQTMGLTDLTNLPSQIGLGYRGAVNLNGVIDALAQDQLINILAEPNLTAVSGETASFLVGGEFPIPVSGNFNQVTIQFKQYGVSLAFVPTVLSSGRVSMKVRPEVSELTDQGSIRLTSNNSSLQIPALSVRRAETTVDLGSGQSFAIAGLIQDNQRQTGRALPFLGEIPILGALFASNSFQRNETELVIVVTPYLVGPTSDPAALQTPNAGLLPPNDVERVLLKRQTGRPAAERATALAPAPRATRPAPGLPGDVGFIIR